MFLALIVVPAHAEPNDPGGIAGEPTTSLPHSPTSPQTAENLFMLGKIWGYMKYHHPQVVMGCFEWDKELLQVADDVAVATDREEASRVLVTWIRRIEDSQTDCGPKAAKEVHYSVDTSWLKDERLLGPALANTITAGSAGPESVPVQHYVTLAEGVRNPRFASEESYGNIETLDWRYRLLALYRFWNIVEYWSPYRHLITEDWDEVLKESIPHFVGADDEAQYVLALMALIARVQDGHANLWSALSARPPAGVLDISVHIRPIEGLPFVWREPMVENTDPSGEVTGPGLAFGDVIIAVNGTSVSELVETWSPYYGVSNHAALLREAYKNLLRGSEGIVNVLVERDGEELNLTLEREAADQVGYRTHDRDGETLQMLSENIAYLKLSSVSQTSIAEYLRAIVGCRGLIIDIRNYPSEFVVFSLGRHLVEEATPFARFTHGDLKSPGTFYWTDPLELTPAKPFFNGRVVILVDESSQSMAEYTAMAFRAAPDAVVVGSQTAGADGNISAIPLPGGHRTAISGIGVFYPDKAPTQRIGIVPDVAVIPTVAGMRAGRDEVLERAVTEIMQEEYSLAELLDMTRIPHAPLRAPPTASLGAATY